MTPMTNSGLDEAFDRASLSKEEFIIKKFLKNYVDEDYVWMSIILMKKQNYSEESIREKFLEFADLNDVKNFTSHQLKNTENANETLETISNHKQYFLSSSHLDIIRGNDHKILIVLNIILLEIFSASLSHIRSFYRNFGNKYLLLLFILHYELHDNDFLETINIINAIPKKPDEISTYRVNLNTYLEDLSFIDWCYTYLKKPNNSHLNYLYILLTPTNIQERRIFVETVLNLIYIEDDREKLKYIHTLNAIKKAWQQKCFRDEAKTKHKYHLPITKTAKDQLKELATFRNITEGVLLSELIEKEFLKKMCDANGKKLY